MAFLPNQEILHSDLVFPIDIRLCRHINHHGWTNGLIDRNPLDFLALRIEMNRRIQVSSATFSRCSWGQMAGRHSQ
ncbi:MAG: hypothetical protein RLZZ09_2854 [Pseudomonadota bacterium]|jgi:hypothetical protein